MRILIIDNYDSFTYNLVQEIGKVCQKNKVDFTIDVLRNSDEQILGELEQKYSHLILSPGPGRPKDANLLERVIEQNIGKLPILGICLGHQAICEVLGAKIDYALNALHGQAKPLLITEDGYKSALFQNLTHLEDLKVARYHSLIVSNTHLPKNLQVLTVSDDKEIMAVEVHRQKGEAKTYGLQFHPESILTKTGSSILQNFIISSN
jgi:anthranilate synthase/aminodeoxychorismate synthase-like glutamine amidotransferase